MRADDLEEARRAARQFTDRWTDVGPDIWANGREIGRMKSPAMARYVVLIHNTFLFAVNKLVMALKRLRDLESMRRDDV